jgi:RNA polymerase sigma-70 factor, ECF subfamily
MASRGSEQSPHRIKSPDRVVSLPSPEIDEAELLRQIAERRPSAFCELFDRYAPLVRSVMARTIGPNADVDDLVQESLFIVIRRTDTIRDPAALRSFVYSVALRVARNEVRKRAIRRMLPWTSAPSAALIVPPHDAVAAEVLRHVYAALDRLSADLRVAFVLRFVEGHELAEAASLVGCSLATFKRRVRRAQDRFERIAATDATLTEWLERRDEP